MEYRPAVGLTADSLSKIILKFIQDCGLYLNNLVGQGYDGAAVMSGAVSGVQKIIHDKTPYGFYVQCSAHPLLGRCLQSSSRSGRFFRCDGAFILLPFYLCCSSLVDSQAKRNL